MPNGRLRVLPLLVFLAFLAGCAAHYVAPSPASGQTAEIEFALKESSVTSSVSVAIGDCGSERYLGLLRSGMLLRGDNPVIATVVDASKPMAYRLELLGPVYGPTCMERKLLTLVPGRAYRIEVGGGERICGTEGYERMDGKWQELHWTSLRNCNL